MRSSKQRIKNIKDGLNKTPEHDEIIKDFEGLGFQYMGTQKPSEYDELKADIAKRAKEGRKQQSNKEIDTILSIKILKELEAIKDKLSDTNCVFNKIMGG